MNSSSASAAARSRAGHAPLTAVPAPRATASPRGPGVAWLKVAPRHLVAILALLVFPFVASPFITFQVGAQSLVLGMIALSLSFLAGYGGMISLAQMTVAGIAGYSMAVLGHSSSAEISLGWPWWLAVPVAIVIAILGSALIGWLSVRTEGIYTIMITLAIGVAFYYLVLQNYSVFNGFQGLRELKPPTVLGINWRDPLPFYALSLACALAAYFLVTHVVRAPFGIALQGIRDNPRRMAALGYSVVSHRVAAYALSGLIAAVGGILLAWYNALISPGSVGTGWLINILVIAVLGGVKHPLGAFLGALIFVLLQTFAIDLIDRERFNLVIGGVFLAIVLFSPDGLLGLWAKLRLRFGSRRAMTSNQRRQP
ncbi:MAG: branched-chain amino acid ABC transporter permease [Variovorax sp.]|nr:MAG: branched-chain amino acid ABC transporter permease [Variovorax sp.]